MRFIGILTVFVPAVIVGSAWAAEGRFSWSCSRYASITGDRLVVDVPPKSWNGVKVTVDYDDFHGGKP